jgi:tetratricopeptide (TPR) repeat protein
VEQRAVRLLALAEVLEQQSGELAGLMTLEMGKPIVEARAEIAKCALGCRTFAEQGPGWLAPQQIESDAGRSGVQYDPLGPLLAIMPWNFPFWQFFRFAAPAMLAGNVVLLKHAPSTPGCALAIVAVCDEAEPYSREALETGRRLLGDNHPDTLIAAGNFGSLLTRLERYEEAESLLAETVEMIANGALPREHTITGATTRKYGWCLVALGKYAEAEFELLEAHEILTAAVGEDHSQTRKVVSNLVDLYDAWDKPDKGAQWRVKLAGEQ